MLDRDQLLIDEWKNKSLGGDMTKGIYLKREDGLDQFIPSRFQSKKNELMAVPVRSDRVKSAFFKIYNIRLNDPNENLFMDFTFQTFNLT